jgi:sec-independent protein translocase protein TatB
VPRNDEVIHLNWEEEMFQIGFWELVVVAIVALWVLGPEKLPAFARLAGKALSRAKKVFVELKREFE